MAEDVTKTHRYLIHIPSHQMVWVYDYNEDMYPDYEWRLARSGEIRDLPITKVADILKKSTLGALSSIHEAGFKPSGHRDYTADEAGQFDFNAMVENTENKRTFASGATRDGNMDKLDFDGFFVPEVMESFAQYMHKNRKMADGTMRDSDNWQKGFPISELMKSLWRHFFAAWKAVRRNEPKEVVIENLNGLLFNAQALMFEYLRKK